MTTYYVTCHKPDNDDLDRRIQGLGSSGGMLPWYYPIDTIIAMISAGDVFKVSVLGREVNVIVDRHPVSGRLYLTTEGDGWPPNNLLKLPRCP